MKPTREQILQTVAAAVLKDRQETYGTPENSFGLIADLWSSYLSVHQQGPLQPHDVAAMMILLKVARLAKTPTHPDNWTDAAGYAICGGSVAPEQVNPVPMSSSSASSPCEEEDEEPPLKTPAPVPIKSTLSPTARAIAHKIAKALDTIPPMPFLPEDEAVLRKARVDTRSLTQVEFAIITRLANYL